MGSDLNNRAAMNWGPIQTPNQQAAQQNAVNSVDQKQKPLVRAIASLIQAASADLYASNEDRKYRYIVDLILDRVRAALNTQLSDLSDTQLESVSKQNEALLKAISTSTSGIVESAFSKLGVTLDKKQADGILDQFNDKLDVAVAFLKDQIEKGQFSTSSSKKSSGEEDAATKADQLETIKSIDALKRQLAKQFSADKSSNNAPATSSGKKAFKAASALVISKQLSALAKNQKIINQSMTKRFEKSTKTISGGVERLHNTTSNNFYNLNDKLEDSMAKLGRQTKRISAGIVAGVVGAVSVVTIGIKKTFGAVFSGLKAISGGLFKLLFKKPVSILGDLLKKLFMSPGGIIAIVWIARYVWKNWLKPLWDQLKQKWLEPLWNQLKPIGKAIGEWFGGKISFKDMIGKIWSGEDGKSGFKGILKNWWYGEDGKSGFKGLLIDWWFGKDSKGGFKDTLVKFWKDDILPTLKEWIGCDPNKPLVDFILDISLGNISPLGDITIRKVLYALGAYLAINGGVKLLAAYKAVSAAFKATTKAVQTTANMTRAIVTTNKATKAANLAKIANEMAKQGKTVQAVKAAEKAANIAKKARDAANIAKQGQNAAKAAKLAKEAQLATLAAARAAKAAQNAVKVATSSATTAGKTAAKATTAIAGKTALKTVGKVAGGALVAVDVGMDVWNAANAIKAGEYAEAASKTGFATAKAATLAAGPLAPVAYGAIMATEMVNDAIKSSTAEIEGAVDDMNQRTEEVFKTKVLGAIKEQGKKGSIDKLIDKVKNFDKTKAEVDPLTEKMNKLQAELDKMNNSVWSKAFRGSKIRELMNQIDELDMQRREILGKAGLNLNEISKSKDKLLDSKSSRDILRTMTPEMQARFKQIMAEQTKIGPDNMKILPDMQKVLQQLKQEYEGGGPVTEKVDQVGDGVEQIKEQMQETNQKLDHVIDRLGKNLQRQSFTLVNAPQVQVQQQSQVMMDK